MAISNDIHVLHCFLIAIIHWILENASLSRITSLFGWYCCLLVNAQPGRRENVGQTDQSLPPPPPLHSIFNECSNEQLQCLWNDTPYMQPVYAIMVCGTRSNLVSLFLNCRQWTLSTPEKWPPPPPPPPPPPIQATLVQNPEMRPPYSNGTVGLGQIILASRMFTALRQTSLLINMEDSSKTSRTRGPVCLIVIAVCSEIMPQTRHRACHSNHFGHINVCCVHYTWLCAERCVWWLLGCWQCGQPVSNGIRYFKIWYYLGSSVPAWLLCAVAGWWWYHHDDSGGMSPGGLLRAMVCLHY